MNESRFEKEQQKVWKVTRKALPKFLGFIVLCFLLGMISGFIFAGNDSTFTGWFLDLIEGIKGILQQSSAWLLLAIALLLPLLCQSFAAKARKLIKNWDEESEEISSQAEKKISWIIILSNFSMILSFFLITALYSMGEELFENTHWIQFMVGLVSFMAVLIEVVIYQQKAINLIEILNPEKKGTILNPKFQKDWMESCDEAEKLIIGKCSYKAFRATNIACAVLMSVFTICSMCFGTGFLASLAVMILWSINQFVYFYYSMQYGNKGVMIT